MPTPAMLEERGPRNDDEIDNLENRDVRILFQWLEREVKSRLADLDRKVDDILATTVPQESCRPPEGEKRPSEFSGHVVMVGKPLQSDPVPEQAPQNDIMRMQESTISITGRRSETAASVASAGAGNVRAADTEIGDEQLQMNEEQVAYLSKKKGSQVKRGVWDFLEGMDSSPAARIYEKVTNAIIVASVMSSMLKAHSGVAGPSLDFFEGAVDIAFVLEIFVRFLVCPNRLKFFTDFFNIIDLSAGLPPLLLRIYFGFSVAACTATRNYACMALGGVVPVLRLCRLLRRFQQIHLLLAAFKASLEAMPMLIYMYLCIMMSFAAMLYIVEPHWNVESLSMAWWLAIVSMTTVGYGDTTPATNAGKVTVGVFVFTSALYMAVPLGIIGNTFNDVWKDRDKILLIQRTRLRLEHSGYSHYDIPTLFDLFDVDRNGILDIQEFWWMIQAMRLGLTKDRVAELYSAFDGDRSGGIDVGEFLQVLFPGCYVAFVAGERRETSTQQEAVDDPALLSSIGSEVSADRSTPAGPPSRRISHRSNPTLPYTPPPRRSPPPIFDGGLEGFVGSGASQESSQDERLNNLMRTLAKARSRQF